jgi:hypothetical protein
VESEEKGLDPGKITFVRHQILFVLHPSALVDDQMSFHLDPRISLRKRTVFFCQPRTFVREHPIFVRHRLLFLLHRRTLASRSRPFVRDPTFSFRHPKISVRHPVCFVDSRMISDGCPRIFSRHPMTLVRLHRIFVHHQIESDREQRVFDHEQIAFCSPATAIALLRARSGRPRQPFPSTENRSDATQRLSSSSRSVLCGGQVARSATRCPSHLL